MKHTIARARGRLALRNLNGLLGQFTALQDKARGVIDRLNAEIMANREKADALDNRNIHLHRHKAKAQRFHDKISEFVG